MSELFSEKVYGRKLAHAYVALALAQEVARRYVNEHHGDESLRTLLNTLDVTAKLLEQVMQEALPEKFPTRPLPMPCSDMLM